MRRLQAAGDDRVSRLFYLITTTDKDAQVALAESEVLLAGVRPSPRTVLSDRFVDPSRTAYAAYVAELIWLGDSTDGLLAHLAASPVEAPHFAIDARKFPSKGGPDRQALCGEVGRYIVGRPRLDAPEHEFALVIDQGHVLFGRVLARNTTDWHERVHKPFSFSASLEPRVARAAVNLVASPGQAIIDPCCGSGTIVIEAASIGVRAAGFDLSWEMPGRAGLNARHFSLEAVFGVGDARSLAGEFDAVVTNLPYDVFCSVPPEFYEDALRNLRRLAPRAAVFAGRDLSPEAERSGLRVERIAVQQTRSFRRYLHVLSIPVPPPPALGGRAGVGGKAHSSRPLPPPYPAPRGRGEGIAGEGAGHAPPTVDHRPAFSQGGGTKTWSGSRGRPSLRSHTPPSSRLFGPAA